MFAAFGLPISTAISSTGREITVTSSRSTSLVTLFELSSRTPPGLSRVLNFENAGSFMQTRTSHCFARGETTGLSSITTVHFALPPRCSGPYSGRKVAYFPPSTAAFAVIMPAETTPCPPEPEKISDFFILFQPPCPCIRRVRSTELCWCSCNRGSEAESCPSLSGSSSAAQ